MSKRALRQPLDEATLDILRHLREMLAAEQTEYFLVGATARDVLMRYVFGIDTGRMTRDVDFAIALESWEVFDRIRQALIASGRFTQPVGAAAQRLYDTHGYPIDLIPFGPIENPAGEIAWPPDSRTVMNVAGYQEALRAAEQVEIEPGHILRVVSVPGLAVLKLLAWNERGLVHNKDAQDFLFLLANYTSVVNEERLYGDEGLPVLSAAAFDTFLAGPSCLGRIVAASARQQSRLGSKRSSLIRASTTA